MGKLKQAGLVCAGLLGGILISLQFSAIADKETRASLPVAELRTFAEVFNAIKTGYVEPIDDKKLITHAISGMLSNLDPHSSYLDADAFKDLQVGTQGEFGGIGIEVGMEDGLVKVVSPIEDTPAYRAGIKSGDLIFKLDDTPVKGLTLNEAVKKMRGKSLGFEQVYDIRALRIVVPSVPDCYAALSWVHSQFVPVADEFDDYIARPKANGYQSLHTVVRDAAGQPIEVQIRTQAMHDHAEHGVAAHWAYKEAGTKGYAGVSASGEYDAKIAVLRQLLAWERDLSGQQGAGVFDDRIYVLTPDAAIVELPQGATPVDFAYSVHTNLGHRCRGARVDGAMVPLNTPLKNGQTVEVTAAKEGGPSRDWLNPELGFLASHRARAKVRAWFNVLAMGETIAKGREAVEKLLQREGKTAIKLDDLASQLGFNSADDLFEVVGKDEFSLRNIEIVLRPPEPLPSEDELVLLKKPRHPGASGKGGVLVVGVDSLMTQLAKCCKPAPPDLISGFVTRGKGVSVHRADCSNLRNMVNRSGDRVIEVEWGSAPGADGNVYPVDVSVEAVDRQGLLRDISEIFTRERLNVVGVNTQSKQGKAHMSFTVEITHLPQLQRTLTLIHEVEGVVGVRRA